MTSPTHLTPPEADAPNEPIAGRLAARLLRRARSRDAGWTAAVLVLGLAAILAGHAATQHLSPDAAAAARSALDDLQLPRVLPDAALTAEDGAEVRLWSLLSSSRTVVSFYASWCGPCQRELPEVVSSTRTAGVGLVVILKADEDVRETRQQIDNLGLKDVHFFVDHSDEITREAHVEALPTTFLVGQLGRVRDRVVGYSILRLNMLLSRARSDE